MNRANLSDAQIVELYFTRSEKALEATQRRYGDYLYRIAFNILGSEEDSKECRNDAYFALWNHIPPERPRCFKSYIAAIVRNLALSRYRERFGAKRIPTEYMRSLSELEGCVEDAAASERLSDGAALQDLLNAFVRSLSKRRRYIFVSRYYYGDPILTIASALRVSESTVYKELAHIKKHLKIKLHEEGFE